MQLTNLTVESETFFLWYAFLSFYINPSATSSLVSQQVSPLFLNILFYGQHRCITSELPLVIGGSSPEQHLLIPEAPGVSPKQRDHDRGNLCSFSLRMCGNAYKGYGLVPNPMVRGDFRRTQKKKCLQLVWASQRQLRADIFGLASCQRAVGCRMRIKENG